MVNLQTMDSSGMFYILTMPKHVVGPNTYPNCVPSFWCPCFTFFFSRKEPNFGRSWNLGVPDFEETRKKDQTYWFVWIIFPKKIAWNAGNSCGIQCHKPSQHVHKRVKNHPINGRFMALAEPHVRNLYGLYVISPWCFHEYSIQSHC